MICETQVDCDRVPFVPDDEPDPRWAAEEMKRSRKRICRTFMEIRVAS